MITQQDFRDISMADVYKEQKKTCKDCIHCDVCYMRETSSDIDSQLREFGCEDFKDISKYKEVIHGEWECDHKSYRGMYVHCSVCGIVQDGRTNYCPHCGADTRGDK